MRNNIDLRINKEDFKRKLDIKDGRDGKDGKNGKDGSQGPKGDRGNTGDTGKNGLDGSPDTAEQIAEKMNVLRNALDFRVLTNVPDFILSREMGRGDQGGGGGSIIGFRDSTGATISQYVTALQFGTGISTAYSGGVITLTSAGGVTSFNTRTGAITLTTGDVTTALGFTPYNATNPSGYITSSALSPYLTSSTAASTYVPYTGATGDVDLGAHGLTTTALNVNGSILQNSAYAKFGNANPFLPVTTGVDIFGSDNTINGVQAGVGNRNSGTSAYAGFYINNDLASDGLVDHYVFIGLNSSTYSDTTFGTAFAVANQLNFQNTDGPIAYVTNKTGATGAHQWYAGGASTSNLVAQMTNTAYSLSVPMNETQGATLASAATVNIGAATGNYLTISGSVTITAFDTVQAGTRRMVTFTGTPILTNSSALVLPWGNITVVAGDSATFVSKGGGNWICTQYQRSTSTGSGSVVFSVSPTFTGNFTAGANAGTVLITGQTLSLGMPTTGGTHNYATSATISGATKNINLGTGGLAGSTTTIAIGSTAGTSTTTFNGTSIFTSTLRLKGYTVATLPAGTQGDRAFVTDATAPTYGAALVGGGAVVVPVFYNGAAWISA